MSKIGKEVIGRFHSKETFGTVDGPGIRYVAFLQGCSLRCLYCHNPDTWIVGEHAYTMTVDEFVADVLSYRAFIRSGGVTFSGGEPLLQPEFVYEAIKRLKEEGVSSAIDTAGVVSFEPAKKALIAADLILLDIKAADANLCKTLTGAGNEQALKMLDFLEKRKKRVWIRHVLVPRFTLEERELKKLAKLLINYKCVELVELLPFHKMGEFKWESLNLPYLLEDTRVPTNEELEMAKNIFKAKGIPVRI